MNARTKTDVVTTLEKAKDELRGTACVMETEIGSVASVFEILAGHNDTILKRAAAIVGCIENEEVSSVLPKVQTLGAAARRFIGQRLQATTEILETANIEGKLLRRLSVVASGQEVIAHEIKALSVLTNIEVARLGTMGDGFQYLAHELADFSRAMTADTRKLASHADSRRAAIEETKRVLAAELPRLQEALAGIEVDLGNALAVVEPSLRELSRTPAQFRICVEDIARQISGVVTAVQAHDITRQQIEHVQEAFALIAAELRDIGDSENENPQNGITEELARAYAGLTIQSYQLRANKATVSSWASQIKTCMSGIMRVSTSEVVGMGPAVLEQEREVSSQLIRIESLEHSGQAHGESIERILGGRSNLVQLVGEHLQMSESLRGRLRLLALNSIVEASHLGTQADAILAISTSIKDISTAWSGIIDQSKQAMQEILELVKQTNHVMEVFSPASTEKLREAQIQTRSGLDNLRIVAELAAGQAKDMKAATEKMQAKVAEVGSAGDRLDACFSRFDAVLAEIERVRRALETEHPKAKKGYDRAEVEQLFSRSYTTEMERDVLHAALNGTAVPAMQPMLAGNSVELF